jgi:NitT/TauT family transport system substrate-binding protein
MPCSAQTKLNVATINGQDFDNAYVAKHGGIFAKHGLDVQLTRLTAVSAVVATLVSKSADIAPASLPIPLQALDAGIDLVALCGAARISKASPTANLIVKKDSPINSAADLKGKRIAVNSLNSIWHLLLRRWLQMNDVKPGDVKYAEVAFPLMRDVLHNGNVDAIATIDRFAASALSDPANRLVTHYALEVNPDVNSGVWMATREWATAHPEIVKAYVASLEEANTLIHQEPDRARTLLAQEYKTPITFADVQTRVATSDVEFFLSLLNDVAPLQNKIDVSRLIFKP